MRTSITFSVMYLTFCMASFASTAGSCLSKENMPKGESRMTMLYSKYVAGRFCFR
jgi:hypothetical protein